MTSIAKEYAAEIMEQMDDEDVMRIARHGAQGWREGISMWPMWSEDERLQGDDQADILDEILQEMLAVAEAKYPNPPMTLRELADAMERYNAAVAYGSECNAWGDFVADCHTRLRMPPWGDEAADASVPDDMKAYWLDVTMGQSDDYDANGSRVNA